MSIDLAGHSRGTMSSSAAYTQSHTSSHHNAHQSTQHSTHHNQRQEFCVRWNSHLGSIGAAFPQLLAGQRFVDVTLACEGHQVHCHRLVLAACSSYFESILSENPCKHPVIILPADIKLWEIQALVDFMYKGEVNVTQSGLPQLLRCAEQLRIRGLYGSDAALNLNQLNALTQRVTANSSTVNASNVGGGFSGSGTNQQQQKLTPQNNDSSNSNNGNNTNNQGLQGLPSTLNSVNGINHGTISTVSPRTDGTDTNSTTTITVPVNSQQQHLSTTISTVSEPLLTEEFIKKEPIPVCVSSNEPLTAITTIPIITSTSPAVVQTMPTQNKLIYQQQQSQTVPALLSKQPSIVPNVHFAASVSGKVMTTPSVANTASGVSGTSAPASASGEDYSGDDDSNSVNAVFEPYQMLVTSVSNFKENNSVTLKSSTPMNYLTASANTQQPPTGTGSVASVAATLALSHQAKTISQYAMEPVVEDEHNYIAIQDEDDSSSGVGGGGGVGLTEKDCSYMGSNTSATDSDHLNTNMSHGSLLIESSIGCYKRVRRSEACLAQAAKCVSKGQTFQTVSNLYNIPVSTIRFYMARKGILPKRKRGRGASNQGLSKNLGMAGMDAATNMGVTSTAITPRNNPNMDASMSDVLVKIKKDASGNGSGSGDTLMSSEGEIDGTFQQHHNQHNRRQQQQHNRRHHHSHLMTDSNPYKSTAMSFKVEPGAAATAATPIV